MAEARTLRMQFATLSSRARLVSTLRSTEMVRLTGHHKNFSVACGLSRVKNSSGQRLVNYIHLFPQPFKAATKKPPQSKHVLPTHLQTKFGVRSKLSAKIAEPVTKILRRISR